MILMPGLGVEPLPDRAERPSLVAQLARAVGGPLNVNPSASLTARAEAGAARASIGPSAFRFLMAEFERRAKKLLAGDAEAFSLAGRTSGSDPHAG
jgi:2-methylisocitrate lyase-like PEP mutase family enzyme